MSWTQAYQAQFAKPLLNQMIAIIQRDQAAALAVVNAAREVDGNGPLAPIAEFHKVDSIHTGWPWLNLQFAPTGFNRGGSKAERHYEVRVLLALDTAQFDQEACQEDAQDYARMLDMVVTSAGPYPFLADWTTVLPIVHETVPSGLTVPNASGSVMDVFVESHAPQLVRAAQLDVPVLRITVTVLFEMLEV
jgi:hypothetical protein